MSKEPEENETEEERVSRVFEKLKDSGGQLKHVFLSNKAKNIGWKGDPNRNAKNILQEYCQKFNFPLPKYKIITEKVSLSFETEVGVQGDKGLPFVLKHPDSQ